MTIDEILAIEDIGTRVEYLKKGRKSPLPERGRLWRDWNPNEHEIMTDKEKYPKIKVTVEPAKDVYDEKSGRTIHTGKKVKEEEPNRITIPIEQNIVNIQTAFTVGEEPKMRCEPAGEEKALFSALVSVLSKNKIKYQNKKIVRSWLSEQECAEYWYVADDDGFWDKMLGKVIGAFGRTKPTKKLRSVVWSPFRGDRLYPFFDDNGDMVAFSREYRKRELDDTEKTCFMTITKDRVYTWDDSSGWKQSDTGNFAHGFKKLPVMYTHRMDGYCDKIHTLRVRLEKLLSEYGDCIDYHFFPILLLFCDEMPNMGGDLRNRVAQMSGSGANASYLTWEQVPDTVKYEAESLLNMIYSLTDTPRISFDYLIGKGNAVSGEAFKYVFMGAHMAVQNHAEIIGDFMQRRVNFLVSALASINPSLEKPSRTIDIDVEIQPYMIDNIGDKVATAVAAVNGGVWSRKHGIMFSGNVDRIDEELKEIEEDKSKMKEKVGENGSKSPDNIKQNGNKNNK